MYLCYSFITIASVANFVVGTNEGPGPARHIKPQFISHLNQKLADTLLLNDSSIRAKVSSSAKRHVISNRDSYVNAANSLGLGTVKNYEGDRLQHAAVMSSLTRIPQSSYIAPIASNQGYGYGGGHQHHQVGDGGWGWSGGGGYGHGSGSQSSKGAIADLAGLIGLIGLKGLKGTVPFIKKAIIIFIALLPILIPLAIIKLPLVLLKPVLTLGRGSSFNHHLQQEAENAAERLEMIENFNKTSFMEDNNNTHWMNDVQETFYNDVYNDILAKDGDNQCLQRIACEGVFKSLPRVFLRFMGRNSYFLPQGRHIRSTGVFDEIGSAKTRRKDLATLAVNKLKNSQFLTKHRPITEDLVKTEEVCKQYKCTELF